MARGSCAGRVHTHVPVQCRCGRCRGRGNRGPSQDAEASGRDGVGASSLSLASEAASGEL